jgi:transposase
VDTMQDTPTKRRARRHHAPELKGEIINACRQPGASVAAIALSHGVNANLVHRWLKQADTGSGALTLAKSEPAAFVALPMSATGISAMAPEPIRIELCRGATSMSLQWPAQAEAERGAWLREWLQ